MTARRNSLAKLSECLEHYTPTYAPMSEQIYQCARLLTYEVTVILGFGQHGALLQAFVESQSGTAKALDYFVHSRMMSSEALRVSEDAKGPMLDAMGAFEFLTALAEALVNNSSADPWEIYQNCSLYKRGTHEKRDLASKAFGPTIDGPRILSRDKALEATHSDLESLQRVHRALAAVLSTYVTNGIVYRTLEARRVITYEELLERARRGAEKRREKAAAAALQGAATT